MIDELSERREGACGSGVGVLPKGLAQGLLAEEVCKLLQAGADVGAAEGARVLGLETQVAVPTDRDDTAKETMMSLSSPVEREEHRYRARLMAQMRLKTKGLGNTSERSKHAAQWVR